MRLKLLTTPMPSDRTVVGYTCRDGFRINFSKDNTTHVGILGSSAACGERLRDASFIWTKRGTITGS